MDNRKDKGARRSNNEGGRESKGEGEHHYESIITLMPATLFTVPAFVSGGRTQARPGSLSLLLGAPPGRLLQSVSQHTSLYLALGQDTSLYLALGQDTS